MWKGYFFNPKYLEAPHPIRLKSNHNAEISHANHILPRPILILWYGPLKSNWNTIKTPQTMGHKVNYIHAINFINPFHTPRGEGNQKSKA